MLYSSYYTSILKHLVRAAACLAICALGTYIESGADIGLSPWDALNQGLFVRFGITFGRASISVGILVIIIDLILVLAMGTVLQTVCRVTRFEPRNVVNGDFRDHILRMKGGLSAGNTKYEER